MTLYDPAQAPFVVTSFDVNVNALPQASAAVATAKTGVAGQLIVVGAGSDEITGAVMSCTVIVCDAVDEFPHPSVAVHVLVTLYEPAQAPFVVTSFDVSVNVLPQLSVAVATAKTGVAGQLMVEGAGRDAMTGADISCTVIVWDFVDEFPHASVAVHVRVTLYEPAQAPFVVTSFDVNVNALPQASVAVACVNDGTAGQLIVEGAGSAAMRGAVISWTVMV